jgi:signal peptidase
VIVYAPHGQSSATRIIHRSLLLVEAVKEGCVPNVDCVYRIPAACDDLSAWNRGPDLSKYCAGSSEPIDVELVRDGIQLSLTDYPCAVDDSCGPFFTSLVTKGDNNPAPDQRGGISGPVRLEWIVGKARLEVPWFGLIKLSVFGNPRYAPHSDPSDRDNWGIGRATAPSDIWLCLFFSVGALIAIPFAVDVAMRVRRARRS